MENKKKIMVDAIDFVPNEMLEEIINTPRMERILESWKSLGLDEKIFTKYLAPELEDFFLGQEILISLLGIASCKKKIEEGK